MNIPESLRPGRPRCAVCEKQVERIEDVTPNGRSRKRRISCRLVRVTCHGQQLLAAVRREDYFAQHERGSSPKVATLFTETAVPGRIYRIKPRW